MRRALWSIFVVAELVRLAARRLRGGREERAPRAADPGAVEPVRIVEPEPAATPPPVIVIETAPPAAPVPPAPARGRPRASRVRRAVGAALVLAGVLVLADVGLTLTWQEPITALRERSAQHQLARQLRALEVRAPPAPAATARPESRAHARAREQAQVAREARAFARERNDGQAVGELHIERIGLRAIVVRGAAESDLKRGPGLIDGTSMPGQTGTTAIAGHRTTYGAPFRHIDALRRGDTITLRVPYGTFRYAVEGHVVVAPTDLAVLRRTGHDRLVLSACHPLYSVAQRIVVTARLTGVGSRA